jgi:RNA polymerase sigma-70 factor, ECF subfamily
VGCQKIEVAFHPPEIGAQRRQERSAVANFTREIEALLPGLKRYAQYLTRDAVAADDLVQETVANGIKKIYLWRPGTDLRAWLSRILHNLYVNGIRQALRHRAMVEWASAQSLSACLPRQIGWLELRDLERGLARLPEAQRSVVMSIGWDGERYETIAARLGIPTGTVRSRLSRGRATLRELTDAAPALPLHSSRPRSRPAA